MMTGIDHIELIVRDPDGGRIQLVDNSDRS